MAQLKKQHKDQYDLAVQIVKQRRDKRKFNVQSISKREPVITAGVNGFILGSFAGGLIGSFVGFKRMFKYHRLSKFPATILSYGLTTGLSLGVLSAVMKEGAL